ncbi:MAG: hypothetical protein ACYSWW_02975, partial [Planctomycetota bacterium]
MKRLVTTCMIVLFVASIAQGQFTVYTNKANWEAAVVSYMTEDFSDATLNAGVSIASDFGGSVAEPGYEGTWFDRVDDDTDLVTPGLQPLETTISFSSDIYAFGGNWDLLPGAPGLGIVVSLDGTPVTLPVTIDNSYVGEFWGVVSTVPFSEVLLQADGQDLVQETFTLDDMVYSVVLDVDKELILIDGSDEWDSDPDGNPIVPTHTQIEFELLITITNNTESDITDLVVKDRLGGDLEFVSSNPPPSTNNTKGNSNKAFLEWDLGTLGADSSVTIELTVRTDVNPGTGNGKKS